jgi:hypothetical protein
VSTESAGPESPAGPDVLAAGVARLAGLCEEAARIWHGDVQAGAVYGGVAEDLRALLDETGHGEASGA